MEAAARLVHRLAGVSYYKTAAPPVVDLGDLATTDDERRFLHRFYVDGLAEMAHRSALDLSGLEIVGPSLGERRPAGYVPEPGRPLVPFGGGIDSIVTAENVRAVRPAASLFVVSRSGDRFAAIERALDATGLPVVRAERRIDPSLLRSSELGFLNGHVPVTGILSAVAVMAAVLGGHDAVVMANEWSASSATIEVGGRPVNHQWSKSLDFERGFRQMVAGSLGPGLDYFSLLRPRSELWVAERFAHLDRYHRVFRSCNRAFQLDPARRLDHWCGTCDKCCFVDLVLAPFVAPATLAGVFGGKEPLDDAELAGSFRALVGLPPGAKPFECVGDVEECRAAVALAARRADRAGNALLRSLASEVGAVPAGGRLLGLLGEHFVPADYLAA
ncbi:MAG: endonuclease domain-containing protein [Acidimicrobiales bacterium]